MNIRNFIKKLLLSIIFLSPIVSYHSITKSIYLSYDEEDIFEDYNCEVGRLLHNSEFTMPKKYDPKEIVKAGELACNGEYMNPVPWTKLWYTVLPVPIRTKVQMKHVVKAACIMHSSSSKHKMPHNCGRAPHGALKLDVEGDKFMLEEIHHHETLEHDECDTDNELSDVDEEFE